MREAAALQGDGDGYCVVMPDFKTFKRRRLREDPAAAGYSDYQWERAFAAHCSARGMLTRAPRSDKEHAPEGDDTVKSQTQSEVDAPAVRARGGRDGMRPLAYGSIVAAFLFSSLLGFLVPYGLGASLLFGFLLGSAYFVAHTCLVFLVLGVVRRS